MRFKIVIYIGISVLIAGTFFVLPRLIKVKAVGCRDQYGVCTESIIKKVGGVEGQSLSQASANLSKILKDEIAVSSFSSQFVFPNKLRVDIVVATPKFALRKGDLASFALVGKSGVVAAITNSTNLPTLRVFDSFPTVGQKVSQRQLFGLTILNNIFYLYQVREGRLDSDSATFDLPSGVRAIFPSQGDEKALVGALRLILSRLNEGEENSKIKNVTTVDLRFKNPVLR